MSLNFSETDNFSLTSLAVVSAQFGSSTGQGDTDTILTANNPLNTDCPAAEWPMVNRKVREFSGVRQLVAYRAVAHLRRRTRTFILPTVKLRHGFLFFPCACH